MYGLFCSKSGSLPSLRSVTWIRWNPNGVSTGFGDLALLEFERRVGELLDEATLEREVIEVAARAAGVRRVLGVLVGGSGEGDLVLDDLVADAISFCLTFSLSASLAFGSTFSRMWLARTWVRLNRSRLSFRNLRSVASVALRSCSIPPSDPVLELLAKIFHRDAVLEQDVGRSCFSFLSCSLNRSICSSTLLRRDRDIQTSQELVEQDRD